VRRFFGSLEAAPRAWPEGVRGVPREWSRRRRCGSTTVGAASVSPAPPVFESSVLLRLRQLPASGVELDGKSHDLVLESTNLGGVLGLRPQLLAQAVDFHGPARLMGFLAQLGPLRPGAGRGGRGPPRRAVASAICATSAGTAGAWLAADSSRQI
jgi:hypothetical protein